MMQGLDRRTMIALAGGASLLSITGPVAGRPSPTGKIGDFDFQEGRWQVRHRSRSTAGIWSEFDGEVRMHKVMGGQGNVEDHAWQRDGKSFHAIGLRTFDPAQSAWSIFWLDSRWPTTIGSPVVGGFSGNRGIFYSIEALNGRPALSRFVWLVDDSDHCRWTQGSSFDEGKTWDTNWMMWFTRA